MKPINVPVVEADPSDLYLMLLLWQHQTTREAALEIADRNRRASINSDCERTSQK